MKMDGLIPDLKKIANFVHKTKKIQNKESIRAKKLEEIGFKSFDAMHISYPEMAEIKTNNAKRGV